MLRRKLDAPVPGKRRRGRQKTRWKDSCKRDTESMGLKEEDVLNIAADDEISTRRSKKEESYGGVCVTKEARKKRVMVVFV